VRTLPLADAPAFERPARRTALARFALAALVAILAGLALLAARDEEPPRVSPSPAPRSTPLVAVVDVSASVAGSAEDQIAATLEGVARARESAGLILFSDAAAEALPLAAPTTELRRFLPFFRPPPGLDDYYVRDPWGTALGSGTRISVGLRAARRTLERDAGGTGDVLLVSDLDTSQVDLERLERELATYARTPALDVHVLALPGTKANDEAFFRARLGRGEIEHEPVVVGERVSEAAPTGPAPFPGRLALLAVLIGLALALRELIAVPLAWRVHERGGA
jgi:hypothetical protein